MEMMLFCRSLARVVFWRTFHVTSEPRSARVHADSDVTVLPWTALSFSFSAKAPHAALIADRAGGV